MYNFNHLYYFYITAKSSGVSEAAKHLRISQPSLSSQIKVLESTLDVRLFHRVGRHNKLTQAGTMIYGFCRQMFELSEEMTETLSQKSPSASRRIHIGVSDEVDRPFVIEFVSLFLKKHGLVHRPKIEVVSGTHHQLVDRLRFREVDAIVSPNAMIDPDLENLAKAEVPVGLICPLDWPLPPNYLSLRTKQLLSVVLSNNEVPWLMPAQRFKFRTEIDTFFSTNQIKGKIVFESDVIASIARSVVDNIGLAFLPLIYVSEQIRANAVRVLGPTTGYWKYRVWLACHTQSIDDPLIDALSSSFKEVSRFSQN